MKSYTILSVLKQKDIHHLFQCRSWVVISIKTMDMNKKGEEVGSNIK